MRIHGKYFEEGPDKPLYLKEIHWSPESHIQRVDTRFGTWVERSVDKALRVAARAGKLTITKLPSEDGLGIAEVDTALFNDGFYIERRIRRIGLYAGRTVDTISMHNVADPSLGIFSNTLGVVFTAETDDPREWDALHHAGSKFSQQRPDSTPNLRETTDWNQMNTGLYLRSLKC